MKEIKYFLIAVVFVCPIIYKFSCFNPSYVGNPILDEFIGLFLNVDNDIYKYIKRHCDFEKNDTCVIDLKDVFNIDYDLMYIFDGYAFRESVPIIAEGKKSTTDSSSFLYDTEIDHVVLVKNNKIVLERQWDHNFAYIHEGKMVEGEGIFDGRPYTHEAELYTSTIFKVSRMQSSYVDSEKSSTNGSYSYSYELIQLENKVD